MDQLNIKKISFLLNNNKLDEAEKLSLKTIKYTDNNIHVENLLAIIYACKKQYLKSKTILKNILKKDSSFKDAHINLANIYKELFNYSESIISLKNALILDENNVFILFSLAKVLDLNKNHLEAENVYKKIFTIVVKKDKELLLHYCENKIFGGKYLEAKKIANELIKDKDYSSQGLMSIASIEIRKENYLKSLNLLNTLKKNYPKYERIYYNLGYVQALLGDLENAKVNYKKNIELSNNVDAKFALSVLELSSNNYKEGWNLYNHRTSKYNFLNLVDKHQYILWDGKPFVGTLVVHGEQGIGDEIVFSSMLNDLLKLQKKIIVKCDKRLIELLSRSFPKIKFFDKKLLLNDFKLSKHIIAGDLGQLLRKDAKDFKSKNLIKCDGNLVKKYKSLIRTNDKIKVGIAWTSFKDKKTVKKRKISLLKFSEILPMEVFEIINLQYGNIEDDRKEIKKLHNRDLIIYDDVDYTNDLDHLAAIMANCDIIISIESFTLNFAGSHGFNTFGLVPIQSAFFWSIQKNNVSTWFPSIKIFKQDKYAFWDNVINELKYEIKKIYNL